MGQGKVQSEVTVTFKQFIAEGEADMTLALKEPIAKVLKVPRYKVDIHRMSMQKVPGKVRFVLALSIQPGSDSQFTARMIEKLLRRELARVQPEAKIAETKVSEWKGSTGINFDTLYIYFDVPAAALNSSQ